MVKGIELFREKFKDYTDSYTIIGGAACDILMSQAELPFRATKDIDIILIFEDKCPAFGRVFWEFIKEGGYKCGWKNNEGMHFYRFTEPKQGYPVQIELFSRNPDYALNIPGEIIPIHIDDDTSSLSAILLDNDFYRFMLSGREVVDGVTILKAEYIIPFKMYAWLDLRNKKNDNIHVNDKDMRKHKNDVFRLLQLVGENKKVIVNNTVKEVVRQFIMIMQNEEIDFRVLRLNMDKTGALEILNNIYLR